MASTSVALFDLDHTLLAHNSGVLYARAAYRRGQLSALDLLRSALWAFLHWLGQLDPEDAYRRTGELFRGRSAVEVERDVASWFSGELESMLRPGARRALAEHRARGERIVLVTNSSSYVARAAARSWELDDVVANEIFTDDSGRITGIVSSPLCYGVGKLARAEAWARAHGCTLDQAYFYSDSISDLPLLEAVRHPRVVHPDPRLRRVAKQRGWPIYDWSF